MLEKLKDFFYDCSDTLLSIFIVLIMALVITWKLSGAMSIPIFANANDPSEKIIAENPQDSEISISDNNQGEGDNGETNTNTSQEDSNQETSTSTPADSNTEVEVVHVESKDIKIEIPKGTYGAGIAKILKENGLIENTSDFISRVEELKLAPKLRYGTFTIKSNSSVDDIIYIITGTSRSN